MTENNQPIEKTKNNSLDATPAISSEPKKADLSMDPLLARLTTFLGSKGGATLLKLNKEHKQEFKQTVNGQRQLEEIGPNPSALGDLNGGEDPIKVVERHRKVIEGIQKSRAYISYKNYEKRKEAELDEDQLDALRAPGARGVWEQEVRSDWERERRTELSKVLKDYPSYYYLKHIFTEEDLRVLPPVSEMQALYSNNTDRLLTHVLAHAKGPAQIIRTFADLEVLDTDFPQHTQQVIKSIFDTPMHLRSLVANDPNFLQTFCRRFPNHQEEILKRFLENPIARYPVISDMEAMRNFCGQFPAYKETAFDIMIKAGFQPILPNLDKLEIFCDIFPEKEDLILDKVIALYKGDPQKLADKNRIETLIDFYNRFPKHGALYIEYILQNDNVSGYWFNNISSLATLWEQLSDDLKKSVIKKLFENGVLFSQLLRSPQDLVVFKEKFPEYVDAAIIKMIENGINNRYEKNKIFNDIQSLVEVSKEFPKQSPYIVKNVMDYVFQDEKRFSKMFVDVNALWVLSQRDPEYANKAILHIVDSESEFNRFFTRRDSKTGQYHVNKEVLQDFVAKFPEHSALILNKTIHPAELSQSPLDRKEKETPVAVPTQPSSQMTEREKESPVALATQPRTAPADPNQDSRAESKNSPIPNPIGVGRGFTLFGSNVSIPRLVGSALGGSAIATGGTLLGMTLLGMQAGAPELLVSAAIGLAIGVLFYLLLVHKSSKESPVKVASENSSLSQEEETNRSPRTTSPRALGT